MLRPSGEKTGCFSVPWKVVNGETAAPALVFHKYGDRYFLSGMKIEGTRVMYRLPESKAEMELRAQNAPMSEQTLLAYLQ